MPFVRRSALFRLISKERTSGAHYLVCYIRHVAITRLICDMLIREVVARDNLYITIVVFHTLADKVHRHWFQLHFYFNKFPVRRLYRSLNKFAMEVDKLGMHDAKKYFSWIRTRKIKHKSSWRAINSRSASTGELDRDAEESFRMSIIMSISVRPVIRCKISPSKFTYCANKFSFFSEAKTRRVLWLFSGSPKLDHSKSTWIVHRSVRLFRVRVCTSNKWNCSHMYYYERKKIKWNGKNEITKTEWISVIYDFTLESNDRFIYLALSLSLALRLFLFPLNFFTLVLLLTTQFRWFTRALSRKSQSKKNPAHLKAQCISFSLNTVFKNILFLVIINTSIQITQFSVFTSFVFVAVADFLICGPQSAHLRSRLHSPARANKTTLSSLAYCLLFFAAFFALFDFALIFVRFFSRSCCFCLRFFAIRSELRVIKWWLMDWWAVGMETEV